MDLQLDVGAQYWEACVAALAHKRHAAVKSEASVLFRISGKRAMKPFALAAINAKMYQHPLSYTYGSGHRLIEHQYAFDGTQITACLRIVLKRASTKHRADTQYMGRYGR